MGNIEFRIIKKIRCIHSIGTGDLTFKYIISRINYARNHPDYDPSFDVFADFESAVISFWDKNFEAYSSFTKMLHEFKSYRKLAIYTKNELTFQTVNMSHIFLSDEIQVDVFQNRKTALAFLGIKDEDLASNKRL